MPRPLQSSGAGVPESVVLSQWRTFTCASFRFCSPVVGATS